jgi:nucleotide-binding universal stress UspA family protein
VYAKILVTLDGSSLAECTLGQVGQLARLTGAEICLLRVGYVTTFPGVDMTDAEVKVIEEAESYLNTIAARLQKQGLNASVHVRFGHAVDEILEQAKDVDLVAMSTHGRSGFGRWALGSVADRVMRRCPKPVLLCRAESCPVY